ncbi:MAG TPA: beta-N-acetylglucosaminidase domain-containing protein [Myxococcota bacterium]|nr:beta-N-acetylglucosaminidase domain-containing protein [Myxococcota bacterium]HQK52322.1 beta-N-acetylglucosaminidase domain-containing protein [Myxococcota bacterium]
MRRLLVPWIALGLIACGEGSSTAPDLPDAGEVRESTCPPAPSLGEDPVDLAPWFRIRASGTRPRGLWPYESEDGPATIRDGRPDTSWKVPDDAEESWLELDLVPLLGRALPLASIAWQLDGAPPERVDVIGQGTCGGPEAFRLSWENPSMPLDLGNRPAGCLRIVLRPSGPLAVVSLSLSSRDADLAARTLDDPPPTPPTPPRCRDSGVIEGFYGIPWSFRERHDMLQAMASLGLGTYLYAPKNDPLHRSRWREPYPDDERARFHLLAQEARRLGLRFLFGLSPFIDYRDDKTDYQILLEKCRAFLEDGADGIAILADDIEFETSVPVDGAMGAMHVAVVHRLRQDLGLPPVWFVPTVYSDRRSVDWPGGRAYLQSLRDLDPEVVVLWTGPNTGNATLSAADLQAVTEAIGRKPLIWDNFYANDGGDGFFGRLFLAPYQGRTPDLPGATVGIAQNLSIQGALSRLALRTFGEWIRDPGALSLPELRRQAAAGEAEQARSRDPDEDADLLAGVMEVFDGFSSVDPPRDRAIEALAAAVVESLAMDQAPAPAAVGDLLEALAWRASLASRLHHSGVQVDLADELAFPLEKVRLEARIGRWAMGALAKRLGGDDASDLLARADDEALESAQRRYLVSPDAMASLLEAVRRFPAQDLGYRWLTPSPPATTCMAGVPLEFEAGAEGTHLRVAGLPGTVQVDLGRVRWTPPHGGHYEGVGVVWREAPDPGWGFFDVVLDCRDPCQDP